MDLLRKRRYLIPIEIRSIEFLKNCLLDHRGGILYEITPSVAFSIMHSMFSFIFIFQI